MLTESLNLTVERRSQSHTLIQELVDTRTEMLSLFSQLVEMKPFQADQETCDLLQEFCETLVDYTLQAHLNLYRHIEEKLEKRKQVLQLADEIYPRILSTTEIISDFNDKYEEINEQLDATKLEEHLSTLGEALAVRIELEDQLIEVLTRRVRSVETV